MPVGGLLGLLSLLGSHLCGLLLGFWRLIGHGTLGLLRLGGFGRCMTSVWVWFKLMICRCLEMLLLLGMFPVLG